MTTDPDGRRPSRTSLSVRTRLTAAVALLVGLALLVAGLLVYTLESRELDRRVAAQVEEEVSELSRLHSAERAAASAGAVDPAALLTAYLHRNVPADDEVLVGWWGGRARIASSGSAHPEFATSPVLARAVRAEIGSGGSRLVQAPFGAVLVTVQPVRSAATTGALVIGSFVGDQRAELRRIMRDYLAVSIILLVLVSGVAAWLVGRLLGPLRTLRQTAEEITETDLSRRIPEAGSDDITALTRTFNQMLARLEAGFEAQRRFLDDAGHELRTPLTVVRGHLELVDPRDPDEVRVVRDLVLDETDRMSRLVDDLLLLANSERPGFLRPAPVRLAPLLDRVLGKCRALGRRTWLVDETADVVVELDEQRVTQALLQLAHNAVRFTGEGGVVALGGCLAEQGGLLLWVRDDGPGVPDAEKARIFERFARGSAARTDDAGSGLGLSIVAAIARAHGGSPGVTDGPAGGAVFFLHLPVGAGQLVVPAGTATRGVPAAPRQEPAWPAS